MKVSLGLNSVAVKNLPSQNTAAQKKPSNVQSDAINLNNSPNNVAFSAFGRTKTERENTILNYTTWLTSNVFQGADSKSKEDISSYVHENFEDLLVGDTKPGWKLPAADSVYLALRFMNKEGKEVNKNIYDAMVDELKSRKFREEELFYVNYDTFDGFPITELIITMDRNPDCRSSRYMYTDFIKAYGPDRNGKGDAAWCDALFESYSRAT